MLLFQIKIKKTITKKKDTAILQSHCFSSAELNVEFHRTFFMFSFEFKPVHSAQPDINDL